MFDGRKCVDCKVVLHSGNTKANRANVVRCGPCYLKWKRTRRRKPGK